jgi:signal transduction histidine kinase
MSDVPHDIRTSLAVLKSTSELALMDSSLDAELQAKFKTVLKEVERINELLKELPQ